MIRPRYMPPGACVDDPAARLDHSASVEMVSYALAGETLHFVFDWIMQGGITMYWISGKFSNGSPP
jgi:hypothetical protein